MAIPAPDPASAFEDWLRYFRERYRREQIERERATATGLTAEEEDRLSKQFFFWDYLGFTEDVAS